jgi:hypothetical protein
MSPPHVVVPVRHGVDAHLEGHRVRVVVPQLERLGNLLLEGACPGISFVPGHEMAPRKLTLEAQLGRVEFDRHGVGAGAVCAVELVINKGMSTRACDGAGAGGRPGAGAVPSGGFEGRARERYRGMRGGLGRGAWCCERVRS